MELIGIREAARRLGVSDTAVHKAIKAGRVNLAEPTPTGRPRVAWPLVQEQWNANTDAGRRTHAGPRTQPPAPPPPVMSADPPPEPPAPPPAATAAPEQPAPAPEPPRQPTGPSYAASRALREAYQARLAKLEFEERSGKLVDAAEVKSRAFRLARSARDALLTMPDRLAPILASSTDVQEIHRLLLEDIERTCARLADESVTIA
ncbi:MAG: hypothetical protein RL299_460 [Pseudomonadota bacterium]